MSPAPLREGDLVTFFSHTHGCYVPTQVARVGPIGEVELCASPGVWIGVLQQQNDILSDGSNVLLHLKTGPLAARVAKANRKTGALEVEYKSQVLLPPDLQQRSLAPLPQKPAACAGAAQADVAGYPTAPDRPMLSKPSVPLPPKQVSFVPINTVMLDASSVDPEASLIASPRGHLGGKPGLRPVSPRPGPGGAGSPRPGAATPAGGAQSGPRLAAPAGAGAGAVSARNGGGNLRPPPQAPGALAPVADGAPGANGASSASRALVAAGVQLAAPLSVGESVQFWSNTLRTWMPAEVVNTSNGFVELNVKRGHFLSPAEQEQRIRRIGRPRLVTKGDYAGEKGALVVKAKDDLRRVFRIFDEAGGLSPDQYAAFRQMFWSLFQGLPGQGSFEIVDRDRSGRISLDELWAFLWPLLNAQPQMFSQLIKAEPVRKQLDERHARIWMKPEAVDGQWPLPASETCPESVSSLDGAMRQFCALTKTANIFKMFSLIEKFQPFADGQDPIAWLECMLRAAGKPLLLCNKIRRPEYSDKILRGKRAFVIGAGPCGLRTAIELRLFGAQVHVFDRRESFERINVLKMWDFLALDLLQLGARELLPCFLVYKDHIGIRELQAMLLKVCLLLHVPMLLGESGHVRDFRWNDQAPHSLETINGDKWTFDLLFAADSTRSFVGQSIGLPHLPPAVGVQTTRVAVVVNFINAGQEHDVAVNEHCERIRNQEVSDHSWGHISQRLKKLGVNKYFVYLQGETHYFINSPEVDELRQQGIFYNPRLPLEPSGRDQAGLLDASNIDTDALERWFRNIAATYTVNDTGIAREHVDAFWSKRPVAREANGKPAMGIFTFRSPTSRAVAAMKFVAGCPVFIVGDALEEPYWPKGEGLCKGFLSVLDAVHTACLWAGGAAGEADLEDWRQALYRQSSTVPKSLRNPVLLPEEGAVLGLTSANYKYTVDPRTRYLDYKHL